MSLHCFHPRGMDACRNGLRMACVAVLLPFLCCAARADRAYLSGATVRTQVGTEGAWVFLTLDPAAGTRRILITAAGPGLTVFGIPGAIADPQLEVWNQSGVRIAFNDDRADALLPMAGYPVTAGAAKDAGVLLTLAPGVYTVRVSGVGGATGISTITVSDLEPQSRGHFAGGPWTVGFVRALHRCIYERQRKYQPRRLWFGTESSDRRVHGRPGARALLGHAPLGISQ